MDGLPTPPPIQKPTNPFIGVLSKHLKDSNEQLAFSEIRLNDFESAWKRHPTDRLRFIDSLHMYCPSKDEKENLRLHNSLNRLNLHTLHDILLLSGGNAGTRFTTEDLHILDGLVENLDRYFLSMESFFHSMPSDSKRHRLNLKSATSESSAEAGTNDSKEAAVLEFHRLADVYVGKLAELQDFVKRKLLLSRENKDPVNESDPETLHGRPLPLWLQILTKKYFVEEQGLDHPPTTPSIPINYKTKACIKSIGKFACFLSGCVMSLVVCTQDEVNALTEVLQASNDRYAVFTSEGLVWLDDNDHSKSQDHRYWAFRFYDFLKRLPELASVPPDEQSINAYKVSL